MRVLVIGANGLLGSVFISKLNQNGTDVVGAYHSKPPEFDLELVQLDITDTDAVAALLGEHDIDTVINCAAVTDVDSCETNTQLAEAVNGSAPGRIAELCSRQDIAFIQFSTDYVFDGRSEELYTEADSTNPIQAYGTSKLAGERAVREANSDALVVRLSFVYGSRGDTGELVGFPNWVDETLRAGEELSLFVDQHLTPSRAGQVVETTVSLLDSNASGCFHVASRSCVTPYEFGAEICDLTDSDEALLTPCSMADIDRTADRPKHSCLDVSKVEHTLDRPQPTLRTDLEAIATAFADYSS